MLLFPSTDFSDAVRDSQLNPRAETNTDIVITHDLTGKPFSRPVLVRIKPKATADQTTLQNRCVLPPFNTIWSVPRPDEQPIEPV